jgi:hypothetical protein
MSKIYGFVDKVSERGHAFVVDQCGQSHLALSSDVQEDSAGRRFLIEGEEVDFVPMTNPRNPHKPLATQIIPRHREPVDLKTHYELVVLLSWANGKGAAKRPNTKGKDQLWVELQNIVSTGEETLRVGSQLWTRVGKPLKPGQRWRAVDAEICIEEEVAADVQQNTTA